MTLSNADQVTLPIDPTLNACIVEDERIKNEGSLELLQETLRTKLRPLINNPGLYDAISGNIQICVSKEDLSKAIEIIDALIIMHSENQFSSFIGGEQIVMNDGGAMFSTLKQNNLFKDKVLPYHDQERLPGILDASMQTGKIFNEVLFGVYKSPDGQIHSWFQIESSLYKSSIKNIEQSEQELEADEILMELESIHDPENEEELESIEEHSAAHGEHGHSAGHGDHEHSSTGHSDHGHSSAGHVDHGHPAATHKTSRRHSGKHQQEHHQDHQHAANHESGEHKHTAEDHSHAEKEHGHTTGDRGHASREHSHARGEHGHAAAEHVHATGDHGHAAVEHVHTTGDHGHAAAEHGHTTGDHGHASGEHGTTKSKSHVAAVKNKNDSRSAPVHH